MTKAVSLVWKGAVEMSEQNIVGPTMSEQNIVGPIMLESWQDSSMIEVDEKG